MKNMRPIDFVVFDGDSSPNEPACRVSEALMRPITIRGERNDYVILSYYLDDCGMVLDIAPTNQDFNNGYVAELAVRTEREACAKVCCDVAVEYEEKGWDCSNDLANVADECKDKILNRSK